MKNTYYVLHQFFMWGQFFIFDNNYLYVEFVAEFLKPVEAESNKSVLVRHKNHFDFVFHDFIQKLIP